MPLLSLPGAPFTPPLMEGLCVSVGGLSESVVKHSSAALCAWAEASAKRGQAEELLAAVASLSQLLRPRLRLQWEVAAAAGGGGSGGGGGADGGFDPSLSRWFHSILGGGGKAPPAASLLPPDAPPPTPSTHKVDARVVVPALRTLEALLRTGALTRGLGPAGEPWAAALAALVRKRMLSAREDVARVLASAPVLLGLLDWRGRVADSALLSICDLLGHPFPLVRKSVAEKAYVRLLTAGEDILAVPGERGSHRARLSTHARTRTHTPSPAFFFFASRTPQRRGSNPAANVDAVLSCELAN